MSEYRIGQLEDITEDLLTTAKSEYIAEIAGLSRLIHDPSRLAILTALRSTAGASFLYLRRLTGMSKGNLSNHLSKLAEARLVRIEKEFVGKKGAKKGVTTAVLTAKGLVETTDHWRTLRRIGEISKRPAALEDSIEGSPDDAHSTLGPASVTGRATPGRIRRESDRR